MKTRTFAAGCACAVLIAAPAAAAAAQPKSPVIRVLSNRADLVAGGDALVEVRLPHGTRASQVRVAAGRRDVTTAFAVRPNGRFQGLVTGLRNGRTALTARIGRRSAARITITNHPIGGPVISGPQTQPWVCATETNGLGKELDAQCNVKPTFAYWYRSTSPLKLGYDAYDVAHPPTDVAMTTTDQGKRVPLIVRLETGVMDRGIYAIAVLSDPKKPWTPWAPQPAFNGKVDWPFGGDCKPFHKQDYPVDPLATIYGIPPLDPSIAAAGLPYLGLDQPGGSILGSGNALEALKRGFMVATNALNKYGSNCNSVTSAEAVLMLKEHIRENYGPIRYTIGTGSSGGSMQQQQIASEYPGLLDGIQPMASFPDIWELAQEAEDCHVLDHYFDSISPLMWLNPGDQLDVQGSAISVGCRAQLDGPQLGTPDVGSYSATFFKPDFAPGCGLSAAEVYNAKNPRGTRCTLQDFMFSAFGPRPQDGFANRPYDNVGVQYGLRPFLAGQITADQFVDLNEKVGGLDIDWRPTAQRSVADPGALRAVYRGGLITHGKRLESVPMIDIRGADNIEIHSDFHSYVMRERLDRANGHHDNQVLYLGARPLVGDPTSFTKSFDLIDDWLAHIESDRSKRTLAQKVRANRPKAAVDTCWMEGRAITDWATCRKLFPYYSDARIAAGGPLRDDVMKCALRPIARADYGNRLTDAQFARLSRTFASGVCDYSRPGVGQVTPKPWVTFAAGPGGRPLGPPPKSHPLRR